MDGLEEKAELNQKLVAIGATAGSVGLALQHIVMEAHLAPALSLSMTLTAVIGWAIFAVGIVRARNLGRTEAGSEYLETLRADERLAAIRARAFIFGFGAMMGVQVVMLVLWTLTSGDLHFLTIPVAASSTIAAGVTGAVLRNLILTDR